MELDRELDFRVAWDDYPLEPMKFHTLIGSDDTEQAVVEYSPPGAYPYPAWHELRDALKEVYLSREDVKFRDFDNWFMELVELLVEADLVMILIWSPQRTQIIGAATGVIHDSLHYGRTLSFNNVLNLGACPRMLYRAMQITAQKVQAVVWGRSKHVAPFRYDIKLQEV